MPPQNSGRRTAKKPVFTEKAKPPVAASEIMDRIGRQIDDRWPNLRRQVASWLRVGREKLEDLYSSAAQTVSEHKEAFQDRLAEKKALNRTADRGTKAPIHSSRTKKSKTVKKGIAKGSSVRQRSKGKSRSAPKPHS